MARDARRATREQILEQAARLFAERGYAATSINEIGAAVGVSGPAIYWHFRNKEGVLSEMLAGISTRLLEGGRERAGGAGSPRDALDALIEWQVDFALANPALIVVHARELIHLPVDEARAIRRAQRQYVEVWVDVLAAVHPERSVPQLRAAVQSAIGLINTTPYLRAEVDRDELARMLRSMAFAALTHPQEYVAIARSAAAT